MKAIVKKKFKNQYGKEFIPSSEVIEFFNEPEVFDLLTRGYLQTVGVEYREPKKVVKNKKINKDGDNRSI